MDYQEDYSYLEKGYDHSFEELVELRKSWTGCIKTYPLKGEVFRKWACEEALIGEAWICPNGQTHEARFDQESGESHYYNLTLGRSEPLFRENSIRFILEN